MGRTSKGGSWRGSHHHHGVQQQGERAPAGRSARWVRWETCRRTRPHPLPLTALRR
eukprot:gene33343-40476_t